MAPLDALTGPLAAHPRPGRPSPAAHAAEGGRADAHVSIEQGYFIFTLMPSLFCKLRCPHCYLSLEERQDTTVMSVADLTTACTKIDRYYVARGITRKTIVCYWYGGEPTSMGMPYFQAAADAINGVFAPEASYVTKHTVLTSLIGVKRDWYALFHRYGAGELQTSYDGLMRGKSYLRRWETSVRSVVADGLRLATISVVNRALLEDGPDAVLDHLTALGIAETSWLPFMWNEQNDGAQYDQFAPRMAEYSDFMIALTERWAQLRERGVPAPEIGQMRFILTQAESPLYANIAGQTLFLLPNGDFVLPDYRNGWQEYMNRFGNILEQEFEAILTGPARRRYLRRQVLRNGNPDCLSCDHADKCVMEFWKDNRPGDECFGAKRYVDWVLANRPRLTAALGPPDGRGAMLY